jgi:hypothetical protein
MKNKKNTHITKDGRVARKGLYYYMNRAKKLGKSKPGKGTVSDKALKASAKKGLGLLGKRIKKMSAVKNKDWVARTAAWQRKEGKDPKGGLNRKGIASYRAANPGSKLSMAVTTKPSKLKKGSKAANRRKSFCARMSGMKKRLTSEKTANDPNSD